MTSCSVKEKQESASEKGERKYALGTTCGKTQGARRTLGIQENWKHFRMAGVPRW